MMGKRNLRSITGSGLVACSFAALLLIACGGVEDARQGEVTQPTVPPQGATPMQGQPQAPLPVAGTSAPSQGGAPSEMTPVPGTGGSDPSAGAAGVSGAAAGTGGAAASSADPPVATDANMPPNADKIAGIEFMHRILGKWTGMNTASRPFETNFPMTVDMVVSGDSAIFGEFEVDAENNVLWGFNIETYEGTDVLAYRNGGYLLGILRDSRTRLVEHDTARGYYRFCAVKEHGAPVDGCNYIEASYTFVSDDEMIFEVTTRSGRPHVHWEAQRVEKHELPTRARTEG